jgi:KDO2-lipid IV(A) lauroyltransferase
VYYVTWVSARLLGLLPKPFLNALSWCLAFFAFDMIRLRRALILSNIQIAFPELNLQQRTLMGRRSIYHFVATLFETIRGGPYDMLAGLTFKNKQAMDLAMAQKKGVYVVCVHLGNFEVLGAGISTYWSPTTVPVKFVGSGGFDRYVHEQRLRYKIDPIRRTKKGEGYLAIRRALSEARPVGFMLDQARHGEPRLPLFGKPAKTNTSLAAIWRKCPAPIVPAYCKRLSFGVHEIVFLDEIHLDKTANDQQDIMDHSTRLNKLVEVMVKACPDQYWWIHNRWK